MAHELSERFRACGLRLARTAEEMLDEHSSHRTERRGCGYTQATRLLAVRVNQPGDPLALDDLDIFAEWPRRETAAVAAALCRGGWARGWRAVDEAPPAALDRVAPSAALDELRTLMPRLRTIADGVALAESRLIVDLVGHVLARGARELPDVPGMPVKPDIGSCSQAEEFFLEIAHARIRRGGRVNVVVGDDGRPLLLEKMQLGESHSAITVAPIRINGVRIPPGALCALEYVQPEATGTGTPTRHGVRLPLAAIARARFLRLTTLAVPPSIRRRAFSAQVDAQLRSCMMSPLTTTLDELHAFAHSELGA
jgi:hypothetical protein